jgi:molecular chaperone DnaK
VSAKDRATGKTQNITITSSSGLNKDEVEKMVKEAQAHSEEDKKRREMVDLRNQADSLAYSLEKLLADNKDKIDAGQAKDIEEAVAETRKAWRRGRRGAQEGARARHPACRRGVPLQAAGPPSGEGGGPSGPAGGRQPADDVDAGTRS